MKTLLCLILLSRMALVCPAAEIVGWKVPLSYYVGSGLETKGIVRREAAPESSPFFKPGDELWDLKEVMPDGKPDPKLSLDWLVWNATSDQLVAKGDWADLSAIQGLLRLDEQAKQCRVVVNFYQVPENLAPPGADSKPVGTMSLIGRSGKRATAESRDAGTLMKLDTEVTIEESGRLSDIRVTCSAQVPNQPRMEIETAATLKSGEPLWIARDFDGKQGLDFELITSIETMGGALIEDQVMIQDGDVVERLMPVSNPPRRFPAGKGWILTGYLPLQWLMELSLGSQSANPNADPFADTAPAAPSKLPRLLSVKPPEFLHPWLKHDVLDVKELLGKTIPRVKESENLSGYDPIRKCFYFHSTDEKSLDMVEALFTAVCYDPPALVVTNLDGFGECRLVAKSGQKASLSRVTDEKVIKRRLEIEPTIGESGDILDMGLRFEDETNPELTTRIKTATLLTTGKSKELYSGAGNGPENKLHLKAEIQRLPLD
ncbi:MAG: hypothetical protein ABIS50_24695 [Luteolibacter sp.]|uniref:hypothetical protein n=1 Tax=Luteolibacter sp. TaxID=1962973 RepID=UPI0032649703